MFFSTTLLEHDLVADHLEKCEQLRTDVNIKSRKLPTMYWIPKLHKTPYKARFIANSSSCKTTLISKLWTSCLIKVKEHVTRYCDKAYENSNLNLFWSIKKSLENLNKIREQEIASLHYQYV